MRYPTSKNSKNHPTTKNNDIPIAPVPYYLRDEIASIYSNISPGHNFHLYGKWLGDPSLAPLEKDKLKNLSKMLTCKEGSEPAQLAEELNNRNNEMATRYSNKIFFSGEATSPLVVGIGNPHLIEVGLSFLSPYGLPYLPGSSIKGVLRHGAELAKETNKEIITDEKINILFGKADSSDDNQSNQAQKGLLYFWDVIPYPQKDGFLLQADIVTPHGKNYLQGTNPNPPVDNETPIPIPFVVVSKGVKLDFNITYSYLPKEFENAKELEDLIFSIMQFSCIWIGFGAKTSSGYGQIKLFKSQPLNNPIEQFKAGDISASDAMKAIVDLGGDPNLFKELKEELAKRSRERTEQKEKRERL